MCRLSRYHVAGLPGAKLCINHHATHQCDGNCVLPLLNQVGILIAVVPSEPSNLTDPESGRGKAAALVGGELLGERGGFPCPHFFFKSSGIMSLREHHFEHWAKQSLAMPLL